MFSCQKFLRNREYGVEARQPWRDPLFSTLYKSFQVSTRSESTPSQGEDWGAVFGFGFSPDGGLLVAACENNCMLLYDPGNAKLITRKFQAHDGCVNCVRFLDSRMFVTCSDDRTVRVWDVRQLGNQLKVLNGHTSWVKNVEYCPLAGRLVTSGFDGNILAWDINNYSESDRAEQLLYMDGIMRTKVTPDESRMVLSTLSGYFILIQDLDLHTLHDDLRGFPSRLYGGLRILGLSATPPSTLYAHMFNRKRNRIEFISDFPVGDSAGSISAMEVHPLGWCIVSRNTTMDEQAEWTCVHDIQPCEQKASEKSCRDCSAAVYHTSPNPDPFPDNRSPLAHIMGSYVGQILQALSSSSSSSSTDSSSMEGLSREVSVEGSGMSEPESSPLSHSAQITTNDQQTLLNPSGVCRYSHPRDNNSSSSQTIQVGPANGLKQNDNGDRKPKCLCGKDSNVTPRRQRRLLFHSEEPNVGEGYIKEQSFSCDGRIIASPFGNCVRLLAFDANCRELCDLDTGRPRPLRQVAITAGSRSSVLASTFSPTQLMYVAGAEDGSISFCSPKL